MKHNKWVITKGIEIEIIGIKEVSLSEINIFKL